MADRVSARVYTITLDQAFADSLAAGTIARHGDAPLDLAAGAILLPNARAVVAVRAAFIRLKGEALLLPRLISLGDGDFVEATGSALDQIGDGGLNPPDIDPMRRQFLLAQMIVDARKTGVGAVPLGEALRLAQSVGQVIDQLNIEQVNAAELLELGDDEPMAGHWESAFALLRTIIKTWPDELQRLGLIDRSDGRNRQLHRAARNWQTHGIPGRFMIAAGISTSAPAIADLLRVIAFADRGAIVLPHIDCAMSDDEWDALGDDPRIRRQDESPPKASETHPQYHLKLLLDRMGLSRGEVMQWARTADGHAVGADAVGNRVTFIRHMMACSRFTADWPSLSKATRKLPGVHFYDLANPAEEAMTVAIAMREALEVPGRTAALVTPDRALAARVAGHLTRWGITADDSAGTPLSSTSAGQFMLALLHAAASGFAPVPLMELVNHPLAARGDDRRVWLDNARLLDLILRGPRPASGLAAISALIANEKQRDGGLQTWWADLLGALAPLEARLSFDTAAPLDSIVPSLRQSLEALAGVSLWTGADGRALATFFFDLERHASALKQPPLARDLPVIVRNLMSNVAVRPPYGGHPRLFIWGLIEARLQRADIMILSGLNEGQWPQRPTPDPWLAPIVRKRLGLAGSERQIGLSSHDFACALGAPNVIITRARRDSAGPTVASRLRLRMDALLGREGREASALGPHGAWAALLDGAAVARPITRPMLSPPLSKRPRRISVTEVDTMRADPFAFYARASLGLRRLDHIDADPTAAWRGTAVHKLLNEWLQAGDWTVSAMDVLLARLLSQPGISPILRVIWAPRLRAGLHTMVAKTMDCVADGRMPLVEYAEESGTLLVDGITLTGTPDRIDRMRDGSLAIVDYKTGSSPKPAAVEAGYALQLGLLGMMAEQGAFTKADEQVALFEYWRTNRDPKSNQLGWVASPFYKSDKGVERRMNEATFARVAGEILQREIALYCNGSGPFMAKRVPQFAPYADYDQLMRLEEWYGRDGADQEDAGA